MIPFATTPIEHLTAKTLFVPKTSGLILENLQRVKDGELVIMQNTRFKKVNKRAFPKKLL